MSLNWEQIVANLKNVELQESAFQTIKTHYKNENVNKILDQVIQEFWAFYDKNEFNKLTME